MRYILSITILLMTVSIYATMNSDFESFRRDLSMQTAQWKDSAHHQAIRESRDTRDYEVGDTRTFWRWNLSVMPPSWIQSEATCRAVGEHCYLFVADDQWGVHMDQDDVDTVMPYLEEHTMNSELYGAVEMDIDLFGPLPDELDNDPKLIVFYSALGQFNGSQFDGYFSPYNQVTEAEAQQMNPSGHSNECEMIYMTCYPLDPVDPIRISVLSHELQHLIHWGGDPNEDTWVDEGCAELAMVWFGMPDPITGFNTNPDNSLIEWDQQFADYVKVMLFFTYFAEHYDDGSIIPDIVANPANGINGISAELLAHDYTIPFESIFLGWTIANYLNDPVPYEGLYGYELLDLPSFHTQNLHTTLPDDGSGTVSGWAAEYTKVVTGNVPPTFNITTTSSILIAEIRIGIDPAATQLGIWTCEDELSFTSQATSDEFSSVILVFSNAGNTSVSYEYTVEAQNSVDEPQTIEPITFNLAPNPYRSGNLSLSIPSSKPVPVSIFNVRGQIVRQLRTNDQGVAQWDGRDLDGKQVAEGVYLFKADTQTGPVVKKMTVIR